MSDTLPPASRPTLDELCQRVVWLVGASPGPAGSIRIESGDMAVEMSWSQSAATPRGTPSAPATTVATAAPQPVQTAEPSGVDDTFTICAPLVGTFYRAPEPGAPPFVGIGDVVKTGDQVAIIEAMKLMNAVMADQPGRVVDIAHPDGVPVEYGEVLIVLEPI